MFNKVSKALFGDSKVKALKDMGFTEENARQALAAADGNVDRAAELLLSQTSIESTVATQPAADTASSGPPHAWREQQSAASKRAGQAAANRAENASRQFGANKKIVAKQSNATKSNTTMNSRPSASTNDTQKKNLHPNVKMPAQMKDKGKEEQILRCTKRLSPYPLAVDTLIRALTAIRNDPNNSKYRRVDKSTPGFKKALQDKPGAHDLLLAMNFIQLTGSENHVMVMDGGAVDNALLYLGISALEGVRESEEYKSAKRQIAFQRELEKIQSSRGNDQNDQEEVLKRAAFMAKCPSEPASGAGALMILNLGDEKLMRRFDGDDVLSDVMNWIGGHGSMIPEKIASRDWCLVDLNKYPIEPIDTVNNMGRTLQYIGCWPSGKLEIRPSSTEWKEGK